MPSGATSGSCLPLMVPRDFREGSRHGIMCEISWGKYPERFREESGFWKRVPEGFREGFGKVPLCLNFLKTFPGRFREGSATIPGFPPNRFWNASLHEICMEHIHSNKYNQLVCAGKGPCSSTKGESKGHEGGGHKEVDRPHFRALSEGVENSV